MGALTNNRGGRDSDVFNFQGLIQQATTNQPRTSSVNSYQFPTRIFSRLLPYLTLPSTKPLSMLQYSPLSARAMNLLYRVWQL